MEVNFNKAKFSTRMLAFGADLLLMIVTALGLIIASQAILMHTPFYRNAGDNIKNIQYESHLYIHGEDNEPLILCDYYSPASEEEYKIACSEVDKALTEFYTDAKFFDQTDPESGLYLYNEQKLLSGYFIYEDETHTSVVKKGDVTYETVFPTYAKFMKEDAVSYLVKYPGYLENTRVINVSFIFLILLLPITLSVTIYEFIIPLIFRRGRKTIGKLILKLGVVDSRGLSPSFWRFLARFALFLFFEVLLSVVSFLIPLIVSISMFAFSKMNQSFHDYMTLTYVVDTSTSSIFMNEKEYKESQEKLKDLEIKAKDVYYG